MKEEQRNDDDMSLKELTAEVKQLRQIAALTYKGVRYRSKMTLWGLPLVSIATGPDLEAGELRGHAKGIIAIGDIATGFLAIGGCAIGGIALGGFALGGVSFGGCALALFGAMGGLAVGAVAIGGMAVGGIAAGGMAMGYYACGGHAIGIHVVGPMFQSPEAIEFFGRFIPGLKK